MSAEYGNIIQKKREKLEDVIPLSTPFLLCIDPSNLCNFRCEYCAMHYSDRKLEFKKQILDYNLFHKIVEDIKKFDNPIKVIRLSGLGEPLINPRVPDMVKELKAASIANHVEIITNGSLLNPKLNRQLIDSGIDRIRISVESINAEGYKSLSHYNIDFEEFLSNIKDLHDISGDCEIYCKIVDAAVPTENDRKRFEELFKDKCDKYFVDRIIPLWSDFDHVNELMTDQKHSLHGQKILDEVVICPFPFYGLFVNSDGIVNLCSADWERKNIVGDLNHESLTDIWNGEKLRNIWRILASGKRKCMEACEKCMLPTYDCQDNIDAYGEKILKNIDKEE